MACTLDLLGDRWTLLIVRDLFAGKSRYRDFAHAPERIATNILAQRLLRLRKAGLITARPSGARKKSTEYALTPKGQDLYPLLESLRDWGLKHVPGTAARIATLTASQRTRPPGP